MNPSIHQIKVTLVGIRPPIWRRIRVPGEISLDRLHDVLQAAMGWTDSHLHAFQIDGVSYGMHDVELEGTVDERGVCLNLLAREGDEFIYEYDFGDGWEHRVEIEKTFDAEAGGSCQVCIDGERACPPEDCGGIYGYERMLEILRDPDHPEHEDVMYWIGDGYDPEALDIPAINAALAAVGAGPIPLAPVYDDAYLAELDVNDLWDLMYDDEDRVPRNLIDECARRGAEMEDLLDELLTDDGSWRRDVDPAEWWLLLHAVMILGLLPTERAGLMLVEAMQRMSRADDDALQDWFSGYWPALFRNKPESVIPALRALCEDRGLGLYMRANAIEAMVAAEQRGGENALDGALDWLAALAADEQEDWAFRLSAGMVLLDFPRQRYRPLLDDLAARQTQTGPGAYFTKKEVEDAYAEMKDRPVWMGHFEDPWVFYTPEAIEARRQRWEEEALEGEEDEWDGDDMDYEFEDAKTYVRETLKVGRNDPCPCGSGKKYKKCCLH